jgi:hypothetical protein
LNRKHTVFGHVIQGIELLDASESISTNKNDELLELMRVGRVEVVQNPTNDAVTTYRATNTKRSRREKSTGSTAKSICLRTDPAYRYCKEGLSNSDNQGRRKVFFICQYGKVFAQECVESQYVARCATIPIS